MISYFNYVLELSKYVLTSSAVLGVILGAVMLVSGEGSVNLDLEFDFDALDGLSVMFGLPLVFLLLFALLSPLSFWVHSLVLKQRSDRETPRV